MENKEFDDIIKKKLESLSSGSTDDGWELFREKWEQNSSAAVQEEEKDIEESQVDDLFDAKVKQNMSGLRMPFNSAHWIKLKAQLESEALFKKRLFVAKTVEILMLALIVLGVLNVWPIQNEIYQIPVFPSPMVSSIQVDKATAEKYESEQAEIEEKQSGAVSKVVKSINNIGATYFFNGEVNKGLESKSEINSDNNSKTSPVQSNNKVDLEQLFPFLNRIKNQGKPHIDDIEDDEITNNRITSLLENDLDQLNIPNRPIGFPDIYLGSLKKKSSEKSFVSLGVGPKVNLINSPFDPVYEIDPYNTLNTNFNITARVHKEFGPVELYTGVGYTNTSYKPLVIKELYKNQREEFNRASLENIEFKTVNIPVGVKYNVIDHEGLQFYASAGVDVNLIAHSDFEVYDVPANGQRTGTFTPDPKTEKTEINQRALLSQKEFNDGILHGGSLRDNLYATASVGLGLIKNVSDRASIYVEPKYSHFISSQGIGPNLDKVHALSLDVGVRFQLN